MNKAQLEITIATIVVMFLFIMRNRFKLNDPTKMVHCSTYVPCFMKNKNNNDTLLYETWPHYTEKLHLSKLEIILIAFLDVILMVACLLIDLSGSNTCFTIILIGLNLYCAWFYFIQPSHPFKKIKVYNDYCQVFWKKYYFDQIVSIKKSKIKRPGSGKASILLNSVVENPDNLKVYDIKVKFRNGTLHFQQSCNENIVTENEIRFLEKIESVGSKYRK